MITLTTPTDDLVGFGHGPLPRVDLLPPEIGERRRLRRVQAGLGGAVVCALGLVAVLVVGAGQSVTAAQDELDTAVATQGSLQQESAGYRDVTAAYQRSADAQAMLVAAMGAEVRYSRLLNDLSLSIPDGVWLTNAAWTQQNAVADASTATGATPGTTPGLGTLTVSGVAYEHEEVALWLESLAAQPGYADPLLQTATTTLIGSRKVVEFTSTVTLSPDALSRRYLTTGS